MSGEWWSVLIAPAFCIGVFVWIGIKFGIFEKIKGFLGGHSGGISWRPNFNVIRFEGVAKFFRRE